MGQKCISTRWVIMEKFKDNKKIMKACFVACGYEDLNNLKTDSLTCSCETKCLIILTSSVMKLQVETVDLTSASLLLEREIFLRPPPDICPKSQV